MVAPVAQSSSEPSGLCVLYCPVAGLPDLQPFIGKTIDVVVRQQDASTSSLLHRQLWGTDIYTDDSDLVAALYHSGKLPSYRPEHPGDFIVTILVHNGLTRFEGCLRWSISSRTWHDHDGCSFAVVQTRPVTTLKLEQRSIVIGLLSGKYGPKPSALHKELKVRSKQSGRRAHVPTQRAVQGLLSQELTSGKNIVFGLAHDACFRYNLEHMLDVGTDTKGRSSYRLKSEILYLEYARRRFALWTAEPEAPRDSAYDRFVFAEDLEPRTAPPSVGCLPEARCKVLAASLDWEDIKWGRDKVSVDGTIYSLAAMFWRPRVLAVPAPTSQDATE